MMDIKLLGVTKSNLKCTIPLSYHYYIHFLREKNILHSKFLQNVHNFIIKTWHLLFKIGCTSMPLQEMALTWGKEQEVAQVRVMEILLQSYISLGTKRIGRSIPLLMFHKPTNVWGVSNSPLTKIIVFMTLKLNVLFQAQLSPACSHVRWLTSLFSVTTFFAIVTTSQRTLPL